MDFTTLGGFAAFAVLVFIGVATKQLTDSLLNLHGVLVVAGGTLVAMLVNTPRRYLTKALSEVLYIFKEGSESDLERMVPVLVGLAEQCRMRGLSAMKDIDPGVAGGFLSRAAAAALEYNDYQFVRQVLEQEINQGYDEINEVANIYRTMGVLAPMFGLIGTLMGIIGVLKELSNPETVGPAMAVAITSAFYGILFANMVCVPFAGKIRARALLEVKMRSMILDGVLEIMKGSMPMVVERRLQAYL